MHEGRLGAWHGSAWPVRYYPAYPRATAAAHPARTVPGAPVPGVSPVRACSDKPINATALASRKDEVKRRCRTVLQSRAEELLRHSQARFHNSSNVHPTLALV